mmetsp:Transcript_37574/g.86822  ORF Transcript_37574/g.86822 Transcript_37574/m.86822 type:complete len:714 (-) Transcript_37574:26-2167(-)
MKFSHAAPLLGLLLLGSPVFALSPITRVVELLEGLGKKVEAELKTEESLYERYVCWATTVINAKTQTNSEADSRITELKAYIEDLEAGRVELTSERQDLTEQVKGLSGDMEDATAMREQEHEDFLMAQEEMEQAIAALTKSIDVLVAATEDHQEGVFMALRDSTAASSGMMDAKAFSLAMSLFSQVLGKADVEFLQKLLTADVPTWDWKKLNRDATFKSGYKARSGRILEVLQELKATFTGNLAQAESTESKAQSDYESLSRAKANQKGRTSDSLNKMEVEGAARGEAKMSASEELASLQAQVEADGKFISETKSALATKKDEWQTRKVLRQEEVEAIAKAVSILHSDDARDLFKRSFKSQGFSFLTLRSASARSLSASRAEANAVNAANELRAAAAKTGDARLKELVTLVSSKAAGHFDAVITAIDKLVEILKKEETKDLKAKETCESERATNSRTAVKAGRTIDEHTDSIAQLKTEIAKLEAEIAASKEQIESIQDQLKEAGRIRADENAEWTKSDADDKEAAEVVQQAVDVLTAFYQENNLALLQGHQIPVVTAGEAPPPPPPTWENAYGGAIGEHDGIISILTMIKEDILKDQGKAQSEETAAQEAYNLFVADSNFQIETLRMSISHTESVKSNREGMVENHLSLRLTKKGELDDMLSTMAKLAPGCEFITVNYPVRVQNRQIELDGLYKAKTILSSALSGAPAPAISS